MYQRSQAIGEGQLSLHYFSTGHCHLHRCRPPLPPPPPSSSPANSTVHQPLPLLSMYTSPPSPSLSMPYTTVHLTSSSSSFVAITGDFPIYYFQCRSSQVTSDLVISEADLRRQL